MSNMGLLKEIIPGQPFFGGMKGSFYNILRNMEPGTFLDVGAAAGEISRHMLRMSPGSNVIAFEPFPGNFPYFETNCGGDSRVKLYRTAVSDYTGEAEFFVSAVVNGSEPGWEKFKGYSSLGYIIQSGTSGSNQPLKVPVLSLDAVVNEHVRLCKIDVQGGETKVVLGAKGLIERHGVDIFYIEFSGREEAILEFLHERGYSFFDSRYLLVSTRNLPNGDCWNITGPVNISTGMRAFHAWPRDVPRSFNDYCRWMEQQA